ncbi:hypothetical protein CUMW_249250 [Citrus unshiu]|uniref:Uncharacterized protein n=1 Tax=Citrus unshiu TaxID=55188 RepID=A0A2H5QPE9_CITUN|nr:hypothetical protein CUMW_249250 [Citrus unshiu]
MVRDVREAGRGSAVPNLMSSGGNDTMSSSHPLIARCRREENLWNPRPHSITDFQISILPSIRPEFRTRQSPFGKGHQISTTAYLNLLKLAEIIFEQSQTERDLRDGGRLPTSRDSSVAGVPSAAAAPLDALFHCQSPYFIAPLDVQPLKAQW